MSGMSGTGFEREYRHRRWPGAKIGLIPLWALLMVMRFTGPGRPLGPTDLTVLIALTAAVVHVVLHAKRARTLVGPDGLTAIGALRQRRFAWADIHDLRVEPVADWRSRPDGQWVVRAYDHTGRRFALPHVDGEQLVSPADAEPIHTAWTERRGPDWAPRPGTDALIRRHTARRKAWQRAALVAFFAFLGTIILSFALIFDDVEVPDIVMLIVPAVAFPVTGALLSVRARAAGWT
jgi:hypothetical protein